MPSGLHRRLGLLDLEGGALRQLDRDRDTLVHAQQHLEALLQEGALVANDIGGDRDLVVGLGIHEVVAVAVLVEKLVFASSTWARSTCSVVR